MIHMVFTLLLKRRICSICNKTIWFNYDMMTTKFYHNLDHRGEPTKHDKPEWIKHYHKNCEFHRLITENIDLKNEVEDLKVKLGLNYENN